jgi:hypothetical protein
VPVSRRKQDVGYALHQGVGLAAFESRPGLELPVLDGFQGLAQPGPHQMQFVVGDTNERVITTLYEFHERHGGTTEHRVRADSGCQIRSGVCGAS